MRHVNLQTAFFKVLYGGKTFVSYMCYYLRMDKFVNFINNNVLTYGIEVKMDPLYQVF